MINNIIKQLSTDYINHNNNVTIQCVRDYCIQMIPILFPEWKYKILKVSLYSEYIEQVISEYFPILNTDYVFENQYSNRYTHFLKRNFEELYKLPQVEQRSPEWFAQRRDKITASDFSNITGNSPYSSRNTLILKKCGISNFVKII